MPRQRPDLVLRDLDESLRQSQRLAIAAKQWMLPNQGPQRPRFTIAHQDMLIELAFLRSFLAWERFLEESFVLYMLGKKSPRHYSPRRFIEPPKREYAIQLTLPENRQYADWDNHEVVLIRAHRFFVDGQPYERVLKTQSYLFQELQTIRNATVHRSTSSHEKFQKLVRNKIGSFPPHLNVGRFLATTEPKSSPPASFFDYYLNHLLQSAYQIIPV
jgi:hypothetical protein